MLLFTIIACQLKYFNFLCDLFTSAEVFECLYNPYIMKFYCVLFVFLIITSNSSSANQFLKHFLLMQVPCLLTKYIFSYLLSQHSIILDSYEILIERNLWNHLVQLPAHISCKGRPGFSGLYCENKGQTQERS